MLPGVRAERRTRLLPLDAMCSRLTPISFDFDDSAVLDTSWWYSEYYYDTPRIVDNKCITLRSCILQVCHTYDMCVCVQQRTGSSDALSTLVLNLEPKGNALWAIFFA